MTTNHTPGPWRWSASRSIGWEEHFAEPLLKGGPVMASCLKGTGQHNRDVIADCIIYDKSARGVIEAAPELLEALQQTVAALEYWFPRYEDPKGADSEMMNKARTAIAKATGETK